MVIADEMSGSRG